MRLRLLISYGAMLVIVAGVQYASKQSHQAATSMSRACQQGFTAERLHGDIRHFVAIGLQFVAPDASATSRFAELVYTVQGCAGEMRFHASEASESELELDHISGFDESSQELICVLRQIRDMASDSVAECTQQRWVTRSRTSWMIWTMLRSGSSSSYVAKI